MPDSQSGLKYLEGLRSFGKVAPMHKLLGFEISGLGDGTAEVSARPAKQFYNHQGRVHGGFLAALIDSGLGIAVQTRLAGGQGFGTIELKVNYVRKLDADSGLVVCRASVLHAGRTMLTAEARVAGADGKLYAHGSGTFLVYPA